MLDFRVDVAGNGDCSVVNVAGELDIATAPQLVEALGQATSAKGGKVVVNLLETSFIDSTGLTTLFRAHKEAEEHNGGNFAIVCGPDNIEVRRVMELMGFDQVFTVYETLDAAGCA